MILLIAQSVADTSSLSYGWLFAKMVSAMVIIIVLALVTIKYVLPRMIRMQRKADSRIQILDYQPLEQRKVVYLLKIDDKKVALAMTDQGAAKLCEWDNQD